LSITFEELGIVEHRRMRIFIQLDSMNVIPALPCVGVMAGQNPAPAVNGSLRS